MPKRGKKIHWVLVLWLTIASPLLCCATLCASQDASAKNVQAKSCDSCTTEQPGQQRAPTDSKKRCCDGGSLTFALAHVQSHASQDHFMPVVAWVYGNTDTQIADQWALQVRRLNLPPPKLGISLISLHSKLTI